MDTTYLDAAELAIAQAQKRQLASVPASNLEAESALLGAVLLDGGVLDLVSASLRPEHFYRAVHAKVFEVLEDMRRERKPIGPDTLVVELRGRGLLEVIGVSEIARLPQAASTTANAEFHATQIAGAARLRHARRVVAESLSYLCDSHDTPDEQLALVQGRVFEATRALERRSSRNLVSLFREAFERLERRKKGELVGVLTGFRKIDALTRGLQPGEVTVVAARPSVGKSAFALNVARNVAKGGIPVAVFSIEMEGVSLAENLLGSVARVNTLSLRRACLSQAEEGYLLDAGAHAEGWSLEIDDERPVTLRTLRSKALRLKAEGKCSLLVVDYLQMMEADVRGRNRAEEVAEISRGLKSLARELDVPVLALAQLNRESERGERRPRTSDLRESGSIEADADAVLLLHPSYYCPDDRLSADAKAQDEKRARESSRTNAIDVIVAKARLGEQGTCPLWFDKATCYLRGVGDEA